MSIGPELFLPSATAARTPAARSARPAEPAPEFGAVLGAALHATSTPQPRPVAPEPNAAAWSAPEPAAEPDPSAGSPVSGPDHASDMAGDTHAPDAHAWRGPMGPVHADADAPGLPGRAPLGDAPGALDDTAEHDAGARALEAAPLPDAEEGAGLGGVRGASDAVAAPGHSLLDDGSTGAAPGAPAEDRGAAGGQELMLPGGAAGGDAPEGHPSSAELGVAGASGASGAGLDIALERVDADPGRLDGEFRSRLERVIERMRDEYGHEVRVVEGYRTPERQAHLHAQGRTRPGPVVTWTLNSAHTRGRAADVMVDGTYENPAGYARLARVAAEEGLRTLGARDPGHIELPEGAAEPVEAGESGGSGPARIARPAAVARVAAVRAAAPASVARVARPMVVSPGVAGASGRARAGAGRGGVADPEWVLAAGKAGAETSPGESGAEGGARPAVEGAASVTPMTVGVSTIRGSGELSALPGMDMAGRVLEVAELQDRAATRPVSQMLLHLDDVDGGARIRVGVRGAVVDATLDVADRATADGLAARLGELRGALERKGLEPGALRVRPAAGGEEVLEVARAFAPSAAAEGVRGGASSRENGGGWGHESGRDGSTHREKREPEPDHQRSRKGANPEEGA